MTSSTMQDYAYVALCGKLLQHHRDTGETHVNLYGGHKHFGTKQSRGKDYVVIWDCKTPAMEVIAVINKRYRLECLPGPRAISKRSIKFLTREGARGAFRMFSSPSCLEKELLSKGVFETIITEITNDSFRFSL